MVGARMSALGISEDVQEKWRTTSTSYDIQPKADRTLSANGRRRAWASALAPISDILVAARNAHKQTVHA